MRTTTVAGRARWSPCRAPKATPGGSTTGGRRSTSTRTDVGDLPRPQTKIMVNLGNPDLAFKTSFLPNDGVGLARMEFIINESIKAHPLALVHPERVTDPRRARSIERLIRLLPGRRDVLRRAPVGGDRHDRRRVLAQAGRGADVGLQDQRVRQPRRWRRLRAARGQSDARLPRRLALRPPRLRGGLRTRSAAR